MNSANLASGQKVKCSRSFREMGDVHERTADTNTITMADHDGGGNNINNNNYNNNSENQASDNFPGRNSSRGGRGRGGGGGGGRGGGGRRSGAGGGGRDNGGGGGGGGRIGRAGGRGGRRGGGGGGGGRGRGRGRGRTNNNEVDGGDGMLVDGGTMMNDATADNSGTATDGITVTTNTTSTAAATTNTNTTTPSSWVPGDSDIKDRGGGRTGGGRGRSAGRGRRGGRTGGGRRGGGGGGGQVRGGRVDRSGRGGRGGFDNDDNDDIADNGYHDNDYNHQQKQQQQQQGKKPNKGGNKNRDTTKDPEQQEQQQEQTTNDKNKNNLNQTGGDECMDTAGDSRESSSNVKGLYNNNNNNNTTNNKVGNKNKGKNPKESNRGNNNYNNYNNNNKKVSTNNIPSIVPPSQPQQTSDINYGRSKTITLLHVAEKPSIAQAIANGLVQQPGASKTNNNNKGGRSSLPVHELTGPDFPKAPYAASCIHRITSVTGHVYSIDFPSEFQNWDSVDPIELFTAKTQRKPSGNYSIVKHLQNEAKQVDFIVLWMDCDREGENINFEVLSICQGLMKTSSSASLTNNESNYDRVYRAYFSAINPSDIQKAYKNLGKPDQNQALSVDARQELDLKVGVAFSRFQTRYFHGRYGDLDSGVLSYGPCQTPTLGFCVQRHIDIETFKPEPYWLLELAMMKRGRALKATWDYGRSFHRQRVQSMVDTALIDPPQQPVAKVISVISKEKKQGRPIPLNTVALLKACSKVLGIGPHSAMQIAERLYLSGYLSYPRTESTAYPKSFDIHGMLQQQTSDARWGNYVKQLLATGDGGNIKARGGVDVGDHPPITPCKSARDGGGGELMGDMGRVYEFVVRHCIASVSPDAVWKSTKVQFLVPNLIMEKKGETTNDEGSGGGNNNTNNNNYDSKGTFTLQGKEMVSPGFLSVLLHKQYGDDDEGEGEDDEEEGVIPEFIKDEVIPLVAPTSKNESSKVSVTAAAASGGMVRASLNIKERMTTAPGYLTESELIGKMEKHGIGTDASIPTHIQNIQNRNYCTLESGRRLVPSKLGLVLVQGYHLIDSSLVLPQIRSDIEDQCTKIAKGFAGRDDVVSQAITLFREKFNNFRTCIDKMDVLFGASFSKLEDVGKPFTRCGLTRRYLSYIPGPPARLYNKYTETVYPLPAGGEIKQWVGRHCPVEGCNFELCLYSVGQPARTFPLCPRCFNDPDWALDASDLPSDPIDKDDEGKERKIQRMTVGGRSLVLECPLPDEHPLIEENTVSPDPDSDGVLILDPHLGPKWRLVSTRAPTIVYLPQQQISKVTVLDRKDDVLGIHLMKIEFKEGIETTTTTPPALSLVPKNNNNGGGKSYISCFPNDEILRSMVRIYHGSERTKSSSGRGGRGRGRGGRGGRGGGSGRGGRGRGGRR